MNTIINQFIDNIETPSFIFDEVQFQERFSLIDKILNEGRDSSKRINLCYAAKANTFLLTAADKVCDKLEICSQGEMDIVSALSISANKVIYSGVSKISADINKAISQGMRFATAESITHIKLLQEEASKSGVKLEVLLRLNSGAQFGMSKEDIEYILANKATYSALEIVGIHYFKGTQRKNVEKQIKELDMLRSYILELREKYNLELPKLEYGPGLYFPYFSNEDFSDTLMPIKELSKALIEATTWAEVTIEMGRFFAAECGYYLTSVTDIKSANDTNIVILDGGINQLSYSGQMMGMKVPVINKIEAVASPCEANSDYTSNNESKDSLFMQKYMLCGSLCTTADVLVREVELPTLEIGDVIVFENVGAYTITEGIELFLSHSLPSVYLYNKNNSEQIKLVREPLATSTINSIHRKDKK